MMMMMMMMMMMIRWWCFSVSNAFSVGDEMTGWWMDDEEERNTRLHICENRLATTHDKPILRLSIQMTTRNTKLRTTLTNKPRPNHPHAQRSDVVFYIFLYLACPISFTSPGLPLPTLSFSPFLLFSCCILSLFAVYPVPSWYGVSGLDPNTKLW